MTRIVMLLGCLAFFAGCRTIEPVEPEVAAAHFSELKANLLQEGVSPKEEDQYLRYRLIGFHLGYERDLRPLDVELIGEPRRIIKPRKTVEHYPVRVLWEISESRGNQEPRVYQEWRKDHYYYRFLSGSAE